MRQTNNCIEVFEKLFLDKMTFDSESKILDAGCMDNLFLQHLIMLEQKRKEILFQSFIGVDTDEKSIASAQKENLDSRGHFQVNDLTSPLPFQTQEFHIVFSFGTLPHIPFEPVLSVLKRLCSFGSRHFLFNYLSFQNNGPKRFCPQRKRCTVADYYIHNDDEISENINQIAAIFGSEGGFHKARTTISKDMSRLITGKKGDILEDVVCLINL